MLDWLREVIVRHKADGILTDTSVLLLLLVGSYDRDRIARFKNTEKFTPEDFDLLVDFLAQFDKMVATPHVLAEVSNLAGQLGEPARSECFGWFIQIIDGTFEESAPSAAAIREPIFTRLGLTDAGIARLVVGRYPIISTDSILCEHLLKRGVDAVNFDTLRRLAWSI